MATVAISGHKDEERAEDQPVHGHGDHASSWLCGPILWGLVLGAVQAASPLAFWWVDPATVHAMSLCLVAAIYIGFAVADGRPRVIATEALVASVFVLLGAVAVTNTAWILVAGYAAHGLKDYWQERTGFVSGTRWWPPFCTTVDFLVAVVLIIEIVAGVNFHH